MTSSLDSYESSATCCGPMNLSEKVSRLMLGRRAVVLNHGRRVFVKYEPLDNDNKPSLVETLLLSRCVAAGQRRDILKLAGY